MHKQSHYTDPGEFTKAKYVYSAIPQTAPLQRGPRKTTHKFRVPAMVLLPQYTITPNKWYLIIMLTSKLLGNTN